MEEFHKLWNKPHEHPVGFIDGDTIIAKSNTFKILHGTFHPIFSSSSEDEVEVEKVEKSVAKPMPKKKLSKNKKPLENDSDSESKESDEVVNTKKVYIPGVQRKAAFYTRTSSLSAEEHAIYLHLMNDFQANQQALFLNDQSKRDLIIYKNLKERVLTEQAEFINFVKQQWTLTKDKLNYVHPDVKKYVQLAWKGRFKRVKSYPPSYVSHKLVPLVYPPERPEIIMSPMSILAQMGTVPALLLPTFKEALCVCTDYPKMALKHSLQDIDPTLNKVPVSRDRNAEHLARMNAADIVISVSALKCIADNQPSTFDRTWDIPVIIREYTMKVGKEIIKKNVVFVDNPFPSKSLTAVELNQWYHRLGVKSLLCHPKHMKAYKFSNPGNIPDLPCYASDSSSILKQSLTSPSQKEMCPECLLPSVSPKNSAVQNREQSCTYSDDSDNTLVIDCDVFDSNNVKEEKSIFIKEEKSMGTKKGSLGLKSDFCTCSKPIQGGNHASVSAHTVSSPPTNMNDSTEEENIYVPPTQNTNVEYRLWKLYRSTRAKEELNENILKGQDEYNNLKIIVRSKLDACEMIDTDMVPICLFTKLEYQTEYGAEMLTLSENIRQWMTLFFRPSTLLARIRVCALTSEILQFERRTLRDVSLEGGPESGRVHKAALGTLYSVLTPLTRLPKGQFLLRHSGRTGAFIDIHIASSKQNGYNLHEDYMNIDPYTFPIQGSSKWTPIDPNVVTLRHKYLKQVPAMFNPKKFQKNQGPAKKKNNSKKKKKKNARKNKTQAKTVTTQKKN